MPSEPEFAVLHQEMLHLLKEIHKFCVKNGIEYTLDGGTLLGAVREGGFIPWDNDIDMAVTRSEYKKLCAAVNRQPVGDAITFENKQRQTRFYLQREGRPMVFLDVGIWDYIADNKIVQKLKLYGSLFLRMFIQDENELAVSKRFNRYSAWKYRVYDCLQAVGRLIPNAVSLGSFQFFNEHCLCGKRRTLYRSNSGLAVAKCTVSKEIARGYTLAVFEDTKLMISKRADEILISLYGDDYMTPKRSIDDIEAHRITLQSLA